MGYVNVDLEDALLAASAVGVFSESRTASLRIDKDRPVRVGLVSALNNLLRTSITGSLFNGSTSAKYAFHGLMMSCARYITYNLEFVKSECNKHKFQTLDDVLRNFSSLPRRMELAVAIIKPLMALDSKYPGIIPKSYWDSIKAEVEFLSKTAATNNIVRAFVHALNARNNDHRKSD